MTTIHLAKTVRNCANATVLSRVSSVRSVARNVIVEIIDPATEETYWRENYLKRPYVAGCASFADYGPAYRYGVDTYARYSAQPFVAAESDLMQDWEGARGSSTLAWIHAKHATRDSWARLSDTISCATRPVPIATASSAAQPQAEDYVTPELGGLKIAPRVVHSADRGNDPNVMLIVMRREHGHPT
jgi:hypothetical protein